MNFIWVSYPMHNAHSRTTLYQAGWSQKVLVAKQPELIPHV